MSNIGLRTCADLPARRAALGSAKKVGLAFSMIGLLFLGACASTSVEDLPKTQAQTDLRSNTIFLGQPLSGTVAEGTAAGGILGTGLSVGIGAFDSNKSSSVGFALPIGGMIAGNLAGQYVASKQKLYGAEADLLESITQDVRTKNQHAARTIESMQVVVAEDRARLAELRAAQDLGQDNEDALDQQIAVAQADLATMQQAITKAEEHYATFVDARTIVLGQNQNLAQTNGQEVGVMNLEIEMLQERIRAMKGLVDELASVS